MNHGQGGRATRSESAEVPLKVAIVYNRESRNVINLFGVPNREEIGLEVIERIKNGLKAHGHRVVALEGDKDLVDRLEEFMPRRVAGEPPGLVFNVSYGIQGQARYTHVPSILEMVGVPYVGSGPLAHSLALDKVVTKMILRQHGLPTPDFTLVESAGAPLEGLQFPLIVKPRSEAVSMGLRVVHDEDELAEGVANVYEFSRQPVLVEQYIEGVEINVGLLGNDPPMALPPAMLDFGGEGPRVYSYEDKKGISGRRVGVICPAPIGDDLKQRAQDLAVRTFQVIGCADCARVDMRIDEGGSIHILEINSLPALGPRGSYVAAAKAAGFEFDELVNRLVEEASARYFGTPSPIRIDPREATPQERAFAYLTERRDHMEKRLRDWTWLSSRTHDALGMRSAMHELEKICGELGLRHVDDLSDDPFVHTWQTARGLEGGTLLVVHLDVPVEASMPRTPFQLRPEWIHGEGVGLSRAPLVMMEFALRALRHQRRLRQIPLGVLYYTDEGHDCRYSADTIREAASRARNVLVLRPGNPGGNLVHQRRGQRKYRLRAEDRPRRPGRYHRKADIVRRAANKLQDLSRLSSAREQVSVSVLDFGTEAFPMLLPHAVNLGLVLTYLDDRVANRTEKTMRELIAQEGPGWRLELISDRPPMKERARNNRLAEVLEEIAERWEIPLHTQSSVLPSVAGLVPGRVAVVCGVGPIARDPYTPDEAVERISLLQRSVLLAEFLARDLKDGSRAAKAGRNRQ
ncbi:MAG: hypothetical protein Kow00129_10750 [Thermoleophilia bacterium]